MSTGNVQTHQSSALRLAIDTKMFDAIAMLAAATEAGEMSIEQVAAETGVDHLLISNFTKQMTT